MSHQLPWAGQLERRSTTDRIMFRFFWPGERNYLLICVHVVRYARKFATATHRGPMMPLPVMMVPFNRITMDMVLRLLEIEEEGHQ